MEYRLAIEAVLRAAVAASNSELKAGAARILGFDRTGPDLDQAISDQIDLMIRTGQIQANEGKLKLNEPSGLRALS